MTTAMRVMRLDAGCEYLLGFAQQKAREFMAAAKKLGVLRVRVYAGSNGEQVTVQVNPRLDMAYLWITGVAAAWGWIDFAAGGGVDTMTLVTLDKPNAAGEIQFKKAKALPATGAYSQDWSRNAREDVRDNIVNGVGDITITWTSLAAKGGAVNLKGLTDFVFALHLSDDARRVIIHMQDDSVYRLDVDFSKVDADGKITPAYTLVALMDSNAPYEGQSPPTLHAFARDKTTTFSAVSLAKSAGWAPVPPATENPQQTPYTWKCLAQDIATGKVQTVTQHDNVVPEHGVGGVQFYANERGGTWTIATYAAYDVGPPTNQGATQTGAGLKVFDGNTLIHSAFADLVQNPGLPVPGGGYDYPLGDNEHVATSADGLTFATVYVDPDHMVSGTRQAHVFATREGANFVRDVAIEKYGAGLHPPVVFGNRVFVEYEDGTDGLMLTFAKGAWSVENVVQSATLTLTGSRETNFQMLAESRGENLRWYGVTRVGSGGNVRFHEIKRNPLPPDGDGKLVHKADSDVCRAPVIGGVAGKFLESVESALLWSTHR